MNGLTSIYDHIVHLIPSMGTDSDAADPRVREFLTSHTENILFGPDTEVKSGPGGAGALSAYAPPSVAHPLVPTRLDGELVT